MQPRPDYFRQYFNFYFFILSILFQKEVLIPLQLTLLEQTYELNLSMKMGIKYECIQRFCEEKFKTE
jgi:hypothetical protein